MASELLQRDPAEQSPGQLKKEAEVNELLQQASQSSITAIGCRSVVNIDPGNPSCSNPLTIVHSPNTADPPRGVQDARDAAPPQRGRGAGLAVGRRGEGQGV